ncbi:hypothetical protein C8F01DRAFT_1325737 [Mycena amicta]|nr:hypothetical protein C8F01DRAFT_1325737 [Mycena amicta]
MSSHETPSAALAPPLAEKNRFRNDDETLLVDSETICDRRQSKTRERETHGHICSLPSSESRETRREHRAVRPGFSTDLPLEPFMKSSIISTIPEYSTWPLALHPLLAFVLQPSKRQYISPLSTTPPFRPGGIPELISPTEPLVRRVHRAHSLSYAGHDSSSSGTPPPPHLHHLCYGYQGPPFSKDGTRAKDQIGPRKKPCSFAARRSPTHPAPYACHYAPRAVATHPFRVAEDDSQHIFRSRHARTVVRHASLAASTLASPSYESSPSPTSSPVSMPCLHWPVSRVTLERWLCKPPPRTRRMCSSLRTPPLSDPSLLNTVGRVVPEPVRRRNGHLFFPLLPLPYESLQWRLDVPLELLTNLPLYRSQLAGGISSYSQRRQKLVLLSSNVVLAFCYPNDIPNRHSGLPVVASRRYFIPGRIPFDRLSLCLTADV